MNQKLFTQIRNEWRINLWLCIELLVVSVLVWYIVDCVYVNYKVLSEPRGFDVEHCYFINYDAFDEGNPNYVERTNEETIADALEFADRLRRRPEVEAVAFSVNAYPYNGSNSGADIQIDSMIAEGYVIKRMVEPEFFKVFRYTGANGETPEQLAKLLNGNDILISRNIMQLENPDVDARSLVGHYFREGYDEEGTFPYRVAGVINNVKYGDFMQGQMNRSYIMQMHHNWLNTIVELSVRVRDNMDKDFEENIMKDAESSLRVGNFFIKKVESFPDIRDTMQEGNFRELKMLMIGMAFLLVNIFLGLLGTFWFRTQQRVPDIAIRMVSGATRGDVFRLLILEGMLLLTIVTIPAVIIDINLAHAEINSWYWVNGFFSWGRMLLCAGISYLLLAIMIVAGIAIPAYRAMHITPATALRDE
ncbi:MAG: ABC transporter permease [Muribaculaceae bacterium]|nr:ABC transporter permease [Muribaculaceae bacterium]